MDESRANGSTISEEKERVPAGKDRRRTMSLGLTAAGPAAGEQRREACTDEELQAAARVKLMLGPDRRVLAVTGLTPKDGASALAGRLGVAMAAIDQSPVLVLDGNVVQPVQAATFGIPPGPGLLDLLEGEADLKSIARCVGPANLFVVPLGEPERPLASFLTDANSHRIMGSIRERFRYVLVDVGLVQTNPDGMLLASWTDGVLVAGAAGDLRRHQLTGLKEDLSRFRIPLLGVVLTRGGSR